MTDEYIKINMIKNKPSYYILSKIRQPSKVLYTFLGHSPFAGAFSQKTVKYFWAHMKDA